MEVLEELAKRHVRVIDGKIIIDWQGVRKASSEFPDFRDYTSSLNQLLENLFENGVLVNENTLDSYFALRNRSPINPTHSETSQRFNFSNKSHAEGYYTSFFPNDSLTIVQVSKVLEGIWWVKILHILQKKN